MASIPVSSGSQTPEPRWRRRKDARPRELLESALAVFVERGFARTRMQDVARRAGVTKGTLYLYYVSKDELFKAVVRQTVLAAVEHGEAIAAGFKGSAQDLLRELVKDYWRTVAIAGLGGIPRLVMAEAAAFPDLAKFYFEEVVRRRRRLFAGVLEKGIANGEFRPVTIDYAVRVVFAPLLYASIAHTSPNVFEHSDFNPEEFLNQHVDIILQGIATGSHGNGAHA